MLRSLEWTRSIWPGGWKPGSPLPDENKSRSSCPPADRPSDAVRARLRTLVGGGRPSVRQFGLSNAAAATEA